MQTSKSTQGSTFITVLVTIAVIATSVFYLGQSVIRTAQVRSAQVSELKARIVARNQLERSLALLGDSQTSLVNILPGVQMITLQLSWKSLLVLQSRASSGLAQKTIEYFISRNGFSGLPQAHWSALFSAFGAREKCRKWTSSLVRLHEPIRANALQTCERLRGDARESLFLVGNWKHSDELVLHNLHHKKIYWVVQGDVDLQNGLEFSTCSNIQLEILAAGNLHVKTLRAKHSQGIHLLLHSVSGIVSVEDGANEASVCGQSQQSNNTQMLLTAESSQGVLLGSEQFQAGQVIGCPFPRESWVWKNVKVVGER